MSSRDAELRNLGKLGEWYRKVGSLHPGDFPPFQEWLRRVRSADNQVESIDRETLESKMMEIVGKVHSQHRFLVHDWERTQLPQRIILFERRTGVTGVNHGFLRLGEEGNLSQQEVENAKLEREEVAGAEQGTSEAKATQDQPGQSGEDAEGGK